jgi:hypothetical protein
MLSEARVRCNAIGPVEIPMATGAGHRTLTQLGKKKPGGGATWLNGGVVVIADTQEELVRQASSVSRLLAIAQRPRNRSKARKAVRAVSPSFSLTIS